MVIQVSIHMYIFFPSVFILLTLNIIGNIRSFKLNNYEICFKKEIKDTKRLRNAKCSRILNITLDTFPIFGANLKSSTE